MERKEFRDLAAPSAAHEAIDSLDIEPNTESVPLREARGRVLAERIDAELDVPGFDRASVDGYAVRAADTFGADEADPVRLSLAGSVHAGSKPDTSVEAGDAVEVSTGAVLPPGGDAVVMVERTDRDGDDVLVRTSLAPGDRVMVAGADVAAGERALGPGTHLTAREVGLLSALGVDGIPVRGRPTVGIISTGDELVRPGEQLDSDAGKIYDVNSYTTATAVEAAGGTAKLYPHAGDDYEAMESVLRSAAAECDLVLSSGSTSASAVDVIYRVIEDQGELLLHGVAVKPGKPMLVGRLDGSAYVGLPGYPVSALTIFQVFVAPAIRAAAGLAEPERETVEGSMAVRERYGEGRLRYMPVGLTRDAEGSTLVYPVDKGSGATTSLVEADGIVAVPPDVAYLDRGERVEVRLFSPDVRVPTILGAGEDDPALSRLLDRLERPRYLAVGSRQGRRRLRDGIADVAGVGGDVDSVDNLPDETLELGGWRRTWGLLVPPENPVDVSGIADLVERDLSFVNRTTDSGLRASLDTAIDQLAKERGRDRAEIVESIDGFEYAVRAHESPGRTVLDGKADVGLGLEETAASLGLGFVECGTETLRIVARKDRVGKPAVTRLRNELDDIESITSNLTGYRPGLTPE